MKLDILVFLLILAICLNCVLASLPVGFSNLLMAFCQNVNEG